MKRISETIVLATIIFDENTFVSAVDLLDLKYHGDNLLSITDCMTIWDSRTDSVYRLSGSSLDCFLENTNILQAQYYDDNLFNDLIKVE